MFKLMPGRTLALLLLAPVFFLGCAQTSVVDSWRTDQPVTNEPDKVAVIAVLPDALTRKAVEIDVAKIIADKGSPAIPSSDIPGFSGGIRGDHVGSTITYQYRTRLAAVTTDLSGSS